MSRSLPLWIGKDDDSPPPPRVRLRVFERQHGICQICGRKIRPGDKWTCDHRIAIINGGPNSESNLQVICEWCDDNVKTPADVAEKSRAYERRLSHVGIKRKPKGRPMPGRRDSDVRIRMDGTVVDRSTGKLLGRRYGG